MRLKFEPIHDIKCGRHSGIPWCCIFWFIFVWCPLWGCKRLREWYVLKVVLDWDYVACPICWLTKKNKGEKLKSCNCGTGISGFEMDKNGVWRRIKRKRT